MKNTIEEVADVLRTEGLERGTINYISPNHVADETLAGLIRDAQKAMSAVNKYIAEQLGDDDWMWG